mgnify:CR=1 FL=1
MVADALSRLSMGSLAHVDKEKRELVKDIHRLANLGVCLLDSKDSGVIVQEVVRSSLGAEIKEKQVLDPILMKIKSDVGGKKVVVFDISGDGTLQYQGRLCVHDVDGLRQKILAEVHESHYVVYPCSTKNES